MALALRFDWLNSLGSGRRAAKRRSLKATFAPHSRRLRIEALEARRLLAGVTVSNTNDIVNGSTASIAALVASDGGDGISLREAILAANADATADVIDFGSLTGAIQLTNVGHVGEIAITKALAINGPGAGVVTIRAFAGTATVGDGARIFNIDGGGLPADTAMSLSGLMLTGGDPGNSGGAIRNTEALTVSGCIINSNTAGTLSVGFHGGGIANFGGNLTVTMSTISGNTVLFGRGGAIYSSFGTMTVVQSTVSGNTVTSTGTGGGIYSDYTATTIDSSTIVGNSANNGGGVEHVGIGVLMTITNSTISGNSARVDGGGLAALFSNVNVLHSTITGNRANSDGNATGNGGGIVVGPSVSLATLDHTIVAGNFRGTSTTRDDIFRAVTARYSLIGDNTGATITNNGGNQIGTGGAPINPLLGPLADNGGRTKTHALLAGSPAIDSGQLGIASPPANDQRGAPFLRIVDGDGVSGARIDIGAYEAQQLPGFGPILVVDQIVDEADGNFSATDLSLREAIILSNILPGKQSIVFDPSLYSMGSATIFLTLGELAISDTVAIVGPGSDHITIDGSLVDPTPLVRKGDGIRLVRIEDGLAPLADVGISGLRLRGGDVAGRGGAILNSEYLKLTDCVVEDNQATNGGGIFMEVGQMDILRSTITGNTSANRGGGVCIYYAPATITDSVFLYNRAVGNGGAVISYNQLTITRSKFQSNYANNDAGVFGNNLTISDSYFRNDHATNLGGAIGTAGSLTITRCTLHGNSANDGGGIASNGNVTITDSTLDGNVAFFGGGISHNNGNLSIVNSTISGNDANQGGGILSETQVGYKTNILNCTFSDNNASSLGGTILNGLGLVEIRHSTITAPNQGFNSGGVTTRATNGTQTKIFSSIIDNNVGGDVQFVDGATNPFISLGYNIVGGGNGATGVMNAFIQTGDMVGVDPLLSSFLKENGGPTKTLVPRPGSPAIENGPPANTPGLPTFDQRGFPFARAFNHDATGGTQLDIGAVELQTVANLSIVVDTLVDESDGNYGSGDMSLREAIGLANGSEGANSISIAPALTSGGPAKILLTRGELQVVETLTLPGPGANLLTIDASGNDISPDFEDLQGSRVFNVDSDIYPAMSFIFTLSGFTLTGANYGGGDGDGGAIHSNKTVVLNSCVITGNQALNGAGIYVDAGTMTLNNCTVEGNHAIERGGGILIEDGIAIVNSSTLQNNSADINGGGIMNEEKLVVNSSTISGNSAPIGGGIYSRTNFLNDYSTVMNSTISGNTATNRGGGLYNFRGITTIRFSTITDNDAPAGMGSGVASHGDSDTRTEVTSTIIASNDHSDVDYVNGGANSFDSEGFNLVGNGNATLSPLNAFNQTGDLVGANPLLGTLANNGGPTKTHALAAGSPAINAGNPAAVANAGGVPAFDQRGAAFTRVSTGRIDIGAVERQAIPPAVFGDYNHNNVVDAADYTVWRNTSGQTGVTPFTGADGDGDGVIDRDDYLVWKSHYGQSVPAAGAVTVNGGSADGDNQVALDVATLQVKSISSETPSSPRRVTSNLAPPHDGEGNVNSVPVLVQIGTPIMSRSNADGTRAGTQRTLTPALSQREREQDARDNALLAWCEEFRMGEYSRPSDGLESALVSRPSGEGSGSVHVALEAVFERLAAIPGPRLVLA